MSRRAWPIWSVRPDGAGNPDFVARVKANAPIDNADHNTFFGGGARRYTDYSTLSLQ
jgi:hypothetical protein